MTQEQIQQLETEFWDAADQLWISSKLTAGSFECNVTINIDRAIITQRF